MSMTDAQVVVTCDGPGCGDSETVDLLPLAHRGTYDTRNVRAYLESRGWIVGTGSDDHHLCAECAASAPEVTP